MIDRIVPSVTGHVRRVLEPKAVLLFFESAGSALYFMAFTFHLLSHGYSYSFISWTIASTALVGVFLGPRIGLQVDRSRSRKMLLIASLATMSGGIMIQVAAPELGGSTDTTSILLGVALFALAYNLTVLLLSQYVQPTLRRTSEAAYAYASRIGASGAVLSAIMAFLLFEPLGPAGLIALAAGLILLSAFLATLIPSLNTDPDSMAHEEPEAVQGSSLHFVFSVVRRVPFLIISVITVALTVDAVGANLESIVAYLDAFPVHFIFVASAFEGLLSMAAAAIYGARLTNAKRDLLLPYTLSISLFLMSFTCLLTVNILGGGSGALLFFAFSYIAGSVANSWWGIVSAVWIRRSAENGAYARTMAAIKVPRALITFIGVGTVGVSLDQSGLDVWLLACMASMAFLLLLTYVRSTMDRGNAGAVDRV